MAWDASPAVTSLAGRRVLVTGGGGFIGSHLCRMCRDAAADVRAVGRAAAPPSDAGGVRWAQADLADLDAARRVVAAARPEIVFHLAGHPHATRSLDAVIPTLGSNLLATVHLLTALAEAQAAQPGGLRG